MPTAYTPINLTASNYAATNITDATFTAITSGTGLEMDHADVGTMLVKNTTGGAINFSITVPQPASSGFSDINVGDALTKTYSVDANDTLIIANMGAYQDPSTQKLTVDSGGAGLEFLAFNQVNRSAKS